MQVVVQFLDLKQDLGHLVDGVVAALRRGAVAGNALHVHADLHAAALAAVDVAVGRLGHDHELGPHLAFIDDVLPAQAVAVLFLHRAGDQHRVLIGEEAQILHDLRAVDPR